MLISRYFNFNQADTRNFSPGALLEDPSMSIGDLVEFLKDEVIEVFVREREESWSIEEVVTLLMDFWVQISSAVQEEFVEDRTEIFVRVISLVLELDPGLSKSDRFWIVNDAIGAYYL